MTVIGWTGIATETERVTEAVIAVTETEIETETETGSIADVSSQRRKRLRWKLRRSTLLLLRAPLLLL